MIRCSNCGHENPGGSRFCGACGAELTSEPPAREVRKTVTVLFCDVTGSTSLGEQLDPEALRRTMRRYFEEIRRIVERHGGTVEKFIGDAVMAVFGIPQAHEDDALRAVRAASEIRERVGELGEELGVALSFRTGVNTGEVVAGEGETLVTGDAVNVAARLEQAAPPGDVLIGGTTLALVRDAVVVQEVEALELKGKRDPVPAHRLVSVDPSAEAVARRLDAPLVGRERERARLSGDFELAVAERACHLFTLLGPAGVGKSRLVGEFIADVAGAADVLRARCLHYGDDITYWPLVEILVAIGLDPDAVIGTSPVETQLAFRKVLEARAAERPQVLVLDDIQWAEEVFLDLIEHVAEWSRDSPIFVLCVARPELLEVRPGWGGGKLNATTILLEPLSKEDCERLVDELAGGALDTDLRGRILAAADGNPLFLEEMIAMVSEDDGSELVVPPTIHALLQARLDRLAADERDVIGRGAVEGQVFHRGAVQELAPEGARDSVPGNLQTLVRKDVIRPEAATYPDDDAFRFRHLLIRDAAYDSLPKETRADLHERFAAWLEEQGALVELDEIVGYHLEQAYRNRAALDAADPRLVELARRTADHLAAAGHGALSRGDLGAARGLFIRAKTLLPEGDEARLEILRALQWPLSESGGVDEMHVGVAELEASSDPRFSLFGRTMRVWFSIALTDGGHDRERDLAQIEELRRELEPMGDDLAMAWLEFMSFVVSWTALHAEEGRAALLRGAEHAERAEQPALAGWMRQWEGAALAFGPIPAAEVLRMTPVEGSTSSGLVEQSGVLRRTARMLACQRKFDEARERYSEGVALIRDAGLLRETAGSDQGAAYIERRAGDRDAAEAILRDGAEQLAALGDTGFYPTTLVILAEILALRGADEEASSLCAQARTVMNPADLDPVSHVEAIEGLLAARSGKHAEGEERCRRALELLGDSDFYEPAGGYRLLLARTLIECGKPEEARAAAAEALEIFEAKGDEPAADWARELLASLD